MTVIDRPRPLDDVRALGRLRDPLVSCEVQRLLENGG